MRLIFKAKQQVLDKIYSFSFDPEQPVTWVAGQSIRLEIDTPYGAEERRFSISSAPHEKDIVITTRISRSDFKQALNELQPGDVIDGYSIEGDFVWKKKPAIFIAGGIGITPYYSILKQLAHEDAEYKEITLFYITQHDQAAFNNELRALQQKIKEFNLVHLYGKPSVLSEQIGSIPDIANKLIYIAGSSKTIDELSKSIVEQTRVRSGQIKKDWFTGLQ